MSQPGAIILALGCLCAFGCAKPEQSGGLGVFNPQGFSGRLELAGQYSAHPAAQTSAETKKPAAPK